MNSFCALLVTGQEKAGGGFPRPWLVRQKRPGRDFWGKQVCLLGCPEKPGQASRNWSKGVWGCCLLITSWSEVVKYSDSFA